MPHRIPACPSDAPPRFGPDKPWLAPLAGYSDLPFRLLCRELGAATCVTEMISARGLLEDNRRTGRLLESTEADSPLVVQLFGADPTVMAEAVRILRSYGYYWFDCNMGCSVRKVLRQGAGAALLADTDLALEVAKAMLDASSGSDGLPRGMVGFKLRSGMTPSDPVIPDLALRLQEAGAAWIGLHPRFSNQAFTGRASWDEIASLARLLEIPLLASGDLLTAQAGRECLRKTGATGVMYARGALYNPAIFTEHCTGELAEPVSALRAIINRHIELSRQFGPPEKGFVKMRSLLPRYMHNFPGVGELRRAVCLANDWEGLFLALNRYLPEKEAQ